MKLLVDHKALSAAIATGGAAAAKNSPVDIVNNVRLIAEGSTLRVASTNLDLFAEAGCDALIDKPGEITVPAAQLAQLVAKLPTTAEVLIEREAAHLIVKAGRSRSKLPTLPAADFPAWADDDFASTFVMPGDVFASTLVRVRPACATDAARYYLQGVLMYVQNGALAFGATNRYVGLKVTTELPEGAASCPPVIVPAATIDAAARAFRGEAEITVQANAGKVAFEAGRVRLVSKVVDGSFPDLDRVIPAAGAGKPLVFDREPFGESVERATLATEEGAWSAVIAIPRGEVLEVKGANSLGGEVREELDGVEIAEGFLPFGFTPSYMAAILKAFRGERLTVEQSDANSPLRIHTPDEPEIVAVLATVRINSSMAA